MINERAGPLVREAGAPFLFGPPEGPAFFERYGWQVLKVSHAQDGSETRTPAVLSSHDGDIARRIRTRGLASVVRRLPARAGLRRLLISSAR